MRFFPMPVFYFHLPFQRQLYLFLLSFYGMYYSFSNMQLLTSGLLVMLFSFFSPGAVGQVKWDGEAGDGLWASAANWTGNTLPGINDDVLLDNSIVAGNYTVLLPGATVTVAVKTIAITPGNGNIVQLQLQAGNTAAPALTAAGPGYGITINNGGILLNASGAGSGNAISIADSFRINNGGHYIHNSRSAHAALVTALSKLPGTEKGVFTFDVPGGGYTIASTNRTYGTLVVNATASGGNQVYATSAANPFVVNGDLVIKQGVTLNLDITASTTIKGNYQQEGGVFNLASQSNSNIVFIEGDFIQTAGIITETSGGLPVLQLNGILAQNLRAEGIINNSVGLSINNGNGVHLQSNLSLPYNLSLVNGILHNHSFLVTLQAGCSVHADSLSNNSFINGALRKEGLVAEQHFLFPVGKGITQRWLALKNASGNYTAEFFKANPNTLSFNFDNGIHHISSIEYWSLNADALPAPSASVELSFDNVNSGGVTDMTALRVSQFESGVWTDRGNTATTGTAGSAGSVQSSTLGIFGPAAPYFTLASNNAFQNPLPLRLRSFTGASHAGHTLLQWTFTPGSQPAYVELQSATDGLYFSTIAVTNCTANQTAYQYTDIRKPGGSIYYRLKLVEAGDGFLYSNILQPATGEDPVQTMEIFPSPAGSSIVLRINALAEEDVQLHIVDAQGRLITSLPFHLQKGNNRIPLQLQSMKPGMYFIDCYLGNRQLAATRFVKTGG